MSHAALLVYGLGSNPSMWRGLPEKLAPRGVEAVSAHLRGHEEDSSNFGTVVYTDWIEDITAAIYDLKKRYTRVSLVAHSMGCAVGLHAAQETPLDRLILISPSTTVPKNQRVALAGCKRVGIKEIPNSLFGGGAGRAAKHPGFPQHTTTPIHTLQQNIAVKISADHLLQQETQPTLLIAGDRDKIAGVQPALRLLHRFPAVTELSVIAKGGHNMPMTNLSDKVWDRVAEFYAL